MIMDVDETKAMILIILAFVGVISITVYILRAFWKLIIDYINRSD